MNRLEELRVEVRDEQIHVLLEEVEAGIEPPDLTGAILARYAAEGANQGPTPRGGWLVAAVLLFGLAVTWAIAGPNGRVDEPSLIEGRPEVVKPGENRPQDRPLPLPITVKTEGEILELAKDTRNIRGLALDDEELKVLTRLQSVERLELEGLSQGIHAGLNTDDDLSLLSSFPKLRELSLVRQPDITNQGLRHLGAVPLLDSLILTSTNLQRQGFAELAKLSLRNLELHHVPLLADESLEILARMQLLRSLTLRGRTKITTPGLVRLLIKQKNLEFLYLGLWKSSANGTQVMLSDKMLHALARLKKLRVLDIGNVMGLDPRLAQVTPAGLSVFVDMEQLQELNLSHVMHVDLSVIQTLPVSLEKLCLAGCKKITDAAMEQIANRLTNLRDLDVSYCPQITNKGVEKLLTARELRSLKLSGTGITESVFDAILAEESLEELDMRFRWLTPAMRQALQAMLRMPPRPSNQFPMSKIGKLLMKDALEVVQLLDVPESLKGVRDGAFRTLVAQHVQQAKTEWRDLFKSHGAMSVPIGLSLAEAGELRPKPPADYKGRYTKLTVNNGHYYLTEAEYPELFTIRDALLDVPARLARAIVKSAREKGY
jgi:Leucine Rich repeat